MYCVVQNKKGNLHCYPSEASFFSTRFSPLNLIRAITHSKVHNKLVGPNKCVGRTSFMLVKKPRNGTLFLLVYVGTEVLSRVVLHFKVLTIPTTVKSRVLTHLV